MGYAANTAYYRAEFEKSTKSGDREGARLNAIAYAKLLRLMAAELKTIKDRALVNREADRYELIAAYVTKEGITSRVLELAGLAAPANAAGAAPRAKAPSAKKPSARSAPKAASASSGGMDISKMLSALGVDPARAGTGGMVEPPAPQPVKTPVMTTPVVNPAPPAPVSSPVAAPMAPKTPVAHAPLVGDEWSADMFEKYLPATVVVHADNSCGTGFFVSEEGYFITNHHVVYDGSTPADEITASSGDDKNYGGAKLIAADKRRDVALLKLKTPRGKTPFIPFVSDPSSVRAGVDMMLIGNGLSFGLAPITGTVKFPDFQDGDTLVYTAPTNAGDSGSPVINRAGECIGIHKAREDESGRRNARGIAYATPAAHIVKLLEKWKEEHGLKF